MRPIEVIDISYMENEAYRAFRRASQLSVTSFKAMLAIAVPFIGTLNVCSALSAKIVISVSFHF